MTFANLPDLSPSDIFTAAHTDQIRDNFIAMSTWASYTPTLTQSATVTKTVNHALYIRLGDLVIGFVKMTCSSAGTASNGIRVGLPTAHNLVGDSVIGVGHFQDITADINVGELWTAGAAGGTTAMIVRDNSTGEVGTASDPNTIASGDVIAYQFMYQAQ
jgi:hypothetical protein